MTLSQAKELYIGAGGPNDHSDGEWNDIHKEIEVIVAAKSDRAAGKTINWWRCWDRKYTQTAFARNVRQEYKEKEMQDNVSPEFSIIERIKRILTIVLGGSGDMIQGCQVAHWIQKKVGRENVDLLCLARDETYEPIKLLFDDQINIKQHELKETYGENYQLITNPNILKELKNQYSEIYVICPDLLFRAREYSFDFNKYNCSPQLVVQTRLLTHKYRPQNIIYCSFANTTTKGYEYNQTKHLIESLSHLLPNHQLYVPILLNWNNEKILNSDKNAELVNLPDNVLVDINPPWERALEFMRKSCYAITLDSAPYHLSYQFGLERLCLDPRFGYQNKMNVLWLSRWRNNGLQDSVDINTPAEAIAQLVLTNIRIPQTTLIPKWFVLNNLEVDWQQRLGLKF